MSIDNTIASLIEALAANTAALNANTAALSKGSVPAAPATPTVTTEVVEDTPKAEETKQAPAKAKAAKTAKVEEPKPEPAKEAPKAPATPADLTREIQQALQPILAAKRVPEAKAILAELGGSAANFACIPREKQPAVLEALKDLGEKISLGA